MSRFDLSCLNKRRPWYVRLSNMRVIHVSVDLPAHVACYNRLNVEVNRGFRKANRGLKQLEGVYLTCDPGLMWHCIMMALGDFMFYLLACGA